MRLLAYLFILISFNATAQLSSKHWIPPIHAKNGETYVEDHYIYLSTPETTPFDVTITTGDGNPIAGSPFTVSSGNPVRILIGNTQPSAMFLSVNDVNTVKSNKGLILSASKDFYATFKVRADNHAEMLIAKGYQGIGTQFRLGSLPQSSDGGIRNFFASFMATEDNTTITLSDYDANVEFVSAATSNITSDTQTFTLNEGESVTVSGYTDIPANLSGFIGALVNSDKPIAVNTGNALAGMTSPDEGQDFTFDQIVPYEEIGTEYVAIRGNGSNNVELPLVIATQNATQIFINGNTTPFTTINEGEFVLIPSSFYQGTNNKNMYITTSKPVYLYQIVGGSISDATSGLNFIPPLSCFYQKSVDLIPSVNAIGSSIYTSDVVALTHTGSTLTINNNAVTALPELVQGNPQWSTYRIPNQVRDIKIESTGPLAVGMLGTSNAVGFGGYYSGFGSEPRDSEVTVCSDRNTDLFNLIEGNPDPGGTWSPPLASGSGVFNPNVDAPGSYVYNFTGLCEIINVTVTVSIQQALNPGTSTQKIACRNDAPFDLFPLLGSADLNGTWSPALSGGGSIFNPAVDPAGVYTYSIVSNDVCESVSATVTVIVNPEPLITPISDYHLCDDNLDGNDSNGMTTFNLTSKTTEALNGQTGINVTYHALASEALSGTNPITSLYSGTTTVYVRLQNNITGCFNTTPLNLVVLPKPVVTSPVTLKQCDIDQDAFTNFNLQEANQLITNASDLTFSYFTSLSNAENNVNPITNDTNFPSGNGTIWARVTNNTSGCYRTAQLNLVVSATQVPASFTPIILNECDEIVDNATQQDDANNGYDFFNLEATRNTFLGLFANPGNLTITYYTSLADAEAETNAIDTSVPFRNTVPNYQPIFVRIDSNTNNDCIGLDNYVNLVVNPIPDFDLGNDFLLCLNPQTGLGSQIISAAPVTTGNYSYSWTPSNPDTNASGNESAQFNITQPGTYSVLVTNNDTNCSNTDTLNVTGSSEPLDVTVVLLTPLFDNGLATIEATAVGGYGQYEYSIDGINWQADGIFEDLQNGSYTVLVRDINGCGPIVASEEFYTITYQNFFTPNGDGFNDTWKIDNLPDSYQAKLYIYDRYGKLLKQISRDSKGWDGTYNGNQLPSTDYWFKVEYIENNAEKVFTSHFSLKR